MSSFDLVCSALPHECLGPYTKIVRESETAYLKFDENFLPLFSVRRNFKSNRWELKDAETSCVLASSASRAHSVENITTQWNVVGKKRAYLKFSKKGQKRCFPAKECDKGRAKKQRRAFGRKVLNACHPNQTREFLSCPRDEIPGLSDDEVTSEELECDKATKDCELYVSCYIEDIMQHYSEEECSFLPKKNYMETVQTKMKGSLRRRMINWMGAVVSKFEQTDTSFHLSVNIFDRYLSIQNVPTTRLQLIGCVCLWLASKYIEIRIPEMSDFVYIADNTFEGDDMLRVENEIVNALEFEFTVPTPYQFAQRFSHIVQYMLKEEKARRRLPHLTMFYVEYCTLIHELVGEKPSKIAAAATYAAAFWLCRSGFVWTEDLVHHTGYDLEDLEEIVRMIKYEIYEKPLKDKEDRPHVYKKYESPGREYVALMRYKSNVVK